jgi:hypothetical protein
MRKRSGEPGLASGCTELRLDPVATTVATARCVLTYSSPSTTFACTYARAARKWVKDLD